SFFPNRRLQRNHVPCPPNEDYASHLRNQPGRNRSRIGPRYSSSTPTTLPLCTTSILPSRARDRAASRVGPMRLLQSADGGISPRLDRPRGISLGQHVFPACRFSSSARISRLSAPSDVASKYFDVLRLPAAGPLSSLDAAPLAVHFGIPAWSEGADDGAGVDVDSRPDSTKNSFRIFLLPPPSSNPIPSSSSIRLFLATFGSSSPHSPPNPPRDRSDATTRCQGTRSHGPYGFRPIAPPTARADVSSSRATEP
ncbi:hypothetical protein ACHAWF_001687, partial [Thalassiosira exigua]